MQPVERSPFRFNLEFGVQRGLEQPVLGAVYCTRADGDADRPATLCEDDLRVPNA